MTIATPFPISNFKPQIPSIWQLAESKRIKIRLSDLTALQEAVDYPMKAKKHELPPIVSYIDGKHYIRDGHHRLTLLYLAGETEAEVLLIS